MSTARSPNETMPARRLSRDPILSALRELLLTLKRENVTELDVTVGSTQLTSRRRAGAPPAIYVGGQASEPQEDETLISITTPLSGVFYAAPAPDEPPYVREGDAVEAGQTVALVEAMRPCRARKARKRRPSSTE